MFTGCVQHHVNYAVNMAIRRAYYANLERTQKGELDVTRWLMWFLECFQRAVFGAEQTLASVLTKARFWENFATQALTERQIKVLNRVLDGCMVTNHRCASPAISRGAMFPGRSIHDKNRAISSGTRAAGGAS